MKVFDKYAAYYDLFYKDKDYEEEGNYIHGLISEHHPEAKTILDLGCGTGKHAFHFASLGYQVDGIDFAESMIQQANKSLISEYENQKERLSFYVGDIRNYRNEKKYDVVVSLFHVMSYQVTNADLQASFETAKTHLKKGGILIFDFWYGPGVLSDPPVVRVKRMENTKINVTRIAEPVIHPNDNYVDVNYTILIKENNSDIVEEIKETHKMRYLFLPEIDSILGLPCLNKLGWKSHLEPSSSTWNACVVYRNEKCD